MHSSLQGTSWQSMRQASSSGFFLSQESLLAFA